MLKQTEIQRTLSSARFGSYRSVTDSADRALELYLWNAEVSAALLVPLHFCEVVIRNGIVEALVQVYSSQWPWSDGFRRSLTDSSHFSPKKELINKAGRFTTTGKIVSELKEALIKSWQAEFGPFWR